MRSLAPTLSGTLGGAVDLGSVLGMLASARASGTFRAGGGWLRLALGEVVDCSSFRGSLSPVLDAVTVVRGMMRAPSFAFRAVVGVPSGSLRLSVVGVLLEAARMADEGAEVRA